jgi:hypothetical protein
MIKNFNPVNDERELKPGDHLVSRRLGYTHHGIYSGEGNVIHYSGLAHDLKPGCIEVTSLKDFGGNQLVWVRPHPDAPYTGDQIVNRARSRIGEDGYSVFANNCQHFVRWCIFDKHESVQVDRGIAALAALVLGLVSQLANFAVSAAGTVGGLSAAGIMSGIKALSFGLGGAVGGLVVTPVTLSLLLSGLMHRYVLCIQPGHSKAERRARRIGQVLAYVSGLLTAAAGVAAVSASGAVAGLGGAGIASGLAALGGLVGGGMAAGTFLVMAAPAAASVALGYGAYKIAQLFQKSQKTDGSSPPAEDAGDGGTDGKFPPLIST